MRELRRFRWSSALIYWQSIFDGPLWLRWVALAFFIAAGVTDILDGYLARTWGQQSSLGRMLDPIADKLLVASCLLMLAAEETIRGWSAARSRRHSLPRDIGFRPARISRRIESRRSGDAPRQMEDNRANGCGRVFDRGEAVIARRSHRAGRHASRHHAVVAVGNSDALYWLGLYARRLALYDRRMNVKLRYFAWVRERVGKPEEMVEIPPGVANGRRVDDLAWPRAARNMRSRSKTGM